MSTRPCEKAGSDGYQLFTLERTLDAVAEGESAALGLGVTTVTARLRAIVQAALERG
jgi:hypothetical protein